jgi:ElaB/YqjD/DUF883 family membrane-anchored ribosome-binding protein
MMEKIPTQTGARDQLLADLKTVLQDAEAWLRHGGSLTGEQLEAARTKFEGAIANAKEGLVNLEVVEKSKAAAKATDVYVKENPWKAVGIGAAVGVVLGLLINTRR